MARITVTTDEGEVVFLTTEEGSDGVAAPLNTYDLTKDGLDFTHPCHTASLGEEIADAVRKARRMEVNGK